ncbi:hypothetical protein J2T04_001067 [Chryseobacterium lathyri]|uniref:Uncharacterized protein n=1 Tax=Chryseobacterium lathyri TaxID=395933 RepID=A0ABT9SIS5_9FLAO|nr:hypothetical protein [Chryseobacterium lathyri]
MPYEIKLSGITSPRDNRLWSIGSGYSLWFWIAKHSDGLNNARANYAKEIGK